MTVTIASMRTELLQRLGDSAAQIWSGDEIDQNIKEGYNALTQATGCLWATDVFPDYAFAFNYTSAFELDLFVGGDVLSGLAQFTSEFERDYIDNARGPANHNFHWEFNDGHVTTTEVSGLADLPEDLFEIERATWNTKRIDACRSRELEADDSRYELNKGQVDAYIQDKDGLRRLRKWRVPSAAYAPYPTDESNEGDFDYTSSFEADLFTSVSGIAQFTSAVDADFTSDTDGPADHNYPWEVTEGFAEPAPGNEWGILVQITDITTDAPVGEPWGDFVQIPGEHAMGDPWGIIVGVYKEPNNVRIEYRRRGYELDDNRDFEIPDRYTVYVRHFAQARALEREGPGQDLELAAHYQGRYDAGLLRMLKRRQALQYQRKYVMGGGTNLRGRKPLVRLPWQYGQIVR
jgi:hypothetical protein